MNLIEHPLYLEDIKKVASQPLPWEKLKNKSLLISGSTGLIGSFLTDVVMFLNQEHDLHCKIYALGRN